MIMALIFEDGRRVGLSFRVLKVEMWYDLG
jgi:hypothetical protein